MEFDQYKLTRWARLIKVRDKSVCYMCDTTKAVKEINAHHIYPKADPQHSEKAYNLNNGICLCWRCHREIVHTSIDNWKKYVSMFKNRMRSSLIKKFNKENIERIK